jgi:hypothetical protein
MFFGGVIDMIVSGAWALNALPLQYVLEIPNVGLRLAYVTPLRKLELGELTPYKAPPRKMRGVPMPDYITSNLNSRQIEKNTRY